MKITDLSPQKRDRSRFNLEIDENFVCGVSVNTVAQFHLYTGREVDEAELTQIFDRELFNRFYERTIEYISKAPKSEKKLRQYIKDLYYKKKGKWFAENEERKVNIEAIQDEAIEKLTKLGLVNDAAYAASYVANRLYLKPRSKQLLLYELQAKGVDKELAQNAIERADIDDLKALRTVYFRKYKSYNLELNDRKRVDFLRRKGFDWDLISQFAKSDIRE